MAYERDQKSLRRSLLALLAMSGPWPCPRCGRDMYAWMKLDLGHAVDVSAGGFGGPRRLECRSCNRGKAAAQAREARTVRSAAELAAHNHRQSVRMRREWAKADEEFAQSEHGRDW